MVRKKQPGGTEVQEEVAPITGKILIQAEFSIQEEFKYFVRFHRFETLFSFFQWLHRQHCICTASAGRACDLD